MNKKLMRYLDEADRTEAKIAELQEHLKGVRAAQKAEEDIEIVKSIRSMKLDGRELLAMLTGLQDGTMKIQCEREPGENAGSLKKDNNRVPQKALESEDRKNESMEEMQ